MCVCVSACHVCAGACESQRKTPYPPELQMVVSFPPPPPDMGSRNRSEVPMTAASTPSHCASLSLLRCGGQRTTLPPISSGFWGLAHVSRLALQCSHSASHLTCYCLTCIVWWHQAHLVSITRAFASSETKSLYSLSNPPPPLLPNPWIPLLCSMNMATWWASHEPPEWYVSFCDWLIPLSLLFSSFIRVIAWVRHFLFPVE